MVLSKICMSALRAVEEVFRFVLFGFGWGGVSVWVGDFGEAAVGCGVEAVPGSYEGGGGCCG